eukprot:superscaffoldBa00003985_g18069
MGANDLNMNSDPAGSRPPARRWRPFNSIKFFVFCHSLLQLAQLLVSGYMKSSISTIERRYGLSSQKSGLLASFNEVGNTVLIVFVSFLGSRVHRPRFIGGGALLACLASLLMVLPHFLGGLYEYTDRITSTSDNSSGLCQSESTVTTSSSNQSCSKQESPTQHGVYPLLLMGQLLLGIGAVPIQPFGISYIDDYASKKNSPLYLGILLAVTSIGPALGFLTGSFMLRYYVDFDKLPKDQIKLDQMDLRWVGAWWLGFLVASCLLFLTALPYLFFPRNMPKEDGTDDVESKPDSKQQTNPPQEVSLLQFLKSFPRIALRTLRSPIYLLVVLAQVNLAALLAGLATFMAKFLEKQFSQSVPFSTMMIGGVVIPCAVLGTVLGGALMRRLNLSVSGASRLCTFAILLCTLSALPLLLIGCPTQKNYTQCRCVKDTGFASPGTCGSNCSHFFLPFMVLLGVTSFVASFSQTPSYIMILRTVSAEDKSFAVGVQYMLFRVLAFMPGPVLYGSVIDSTCILWGRKCGRQTSCLYYNLDRFRQRQVTPRRVVFICGGLLCFLLTVMVLRKRTEHEDQRDAGSKGGYELVDGQKTQGENASSKEKELNGIKT